MKRFLVGALIAYLLAGMLFGAMTMPEQRWACPDPSEPHGYVWHGGEGAPPRSDCRTEVGLVDRAGWLAFATVAGPLLLGGKTLTALLYAQNVN